MKAFTSHIENIITLICLYIESKDHQRFQSDLGPGGAHPTPLCDTPPMRAPCTSQPKLAVVGHVEWVRFARVPHVPRAGEIVHGRDPFEEPAGGGAVAAVQLARLAGESTLITALAMMSSRGARLARLDELGVRVRAAQRSRSTRTAVTLVDDSRERTITTFGSRLQATGADEDLPWDELAQMDAVYFTAGDLGALRAARAARVLVASPRALDAPRARRPSGRAGAERGRCNRAPRGRPRAEPGSAGRLDRGRARGRLPGSHRRHGLLGGRSAARPRGGLIRLRRLVRGGSSPTVSVRAWRRQTR